MFREVLNFKQTDMMKHAWGFHSREPGYRTHYCTQLDDPDMVHMVKEGFFSGPSNVGQVGEGQGMFYLTERAIKELKNWKDTEEKMRASQRSSYSKSKSSSSVEPKPSSAKSVT